MDKLLIQIRSKTNVSNMTTKSIYRVRVQIISGSMAIVIELVSTHVRSVCQKNRVKGNGTYVLQIQSLQYQTFLTRIPLIRVMENAFGVGTIFIFSTAAPDIWSEDVTRVTSMCILDGRHAPHGRLRFSLIMILKVKPQPNLPVRSPCLSNHYTYIYIVTQDRRDEWKVQKGSCIRMSGRHDTTKQNKTKQQGISKFLCCSIIRY